MTATLDPITLEVLTQALISVVREMRATVFRTAKSVAIYEAKDDYSKKVKDLEGRLVKDDLELEKMTTELEKLSTDLDHDRRIHYTTTEEDLDLQAKCNEVFVEKESFMKEKMRQNALRKQVKDEGGSLISFYKSSDEYRV